MSVPLPPVPASSRCQIQPEDGVNWHGMRPSAVKYNHVEKETGSDLLPPLISNSYWSLPVIELHHTVLKRPTTHARLIPACRIDPRFKRRRRSSTARRRIKPPLASTLPHPASRASTHMPSSHNQPEGGRSFPSSGLLCELSPVRYNLRSYVCVALLRGGVGGMAIP